MNYNNNNNDNNNSRFADSDSEDDKLLFDALDDVPMIQQLDNLHDRTTGIAKKKSVGIVPPFGSPISPKTKLRRKTEEVDSPGMRLINGLNVAVIQRLLEAAMKQLRRTDVEAVKGMNEIAFKAMVLGVLAAEIRKGEVVVQSEAELQRVWPTSVSRGYADLLLCAESQSSFVVLELKFLSEAYTNTPTKDITEDTLFRYNDKHRRLRPLAQQECITFKAVPNAPDFISITPRQMLELALVQASQYTIYNPIASHLITHRYGVVGYGRKVLIQKLETSESINSSNKRPRMK